MRYISVILIIMFSGASFAAEYSVLKERSTLTFSGNHAGKIFTGVFENWDAHINFDPDNLNDSQFMATIDMSSAKTGDFEYDGTLPTNDWFNVKEFPKANFISNTIEKTESENTYTATGDLTIKGITHPVTLTFTPANLDGSDPVTATGELTIDRLAYDIGKRSDPTADWVGQNILITLDIMTKGQ